MRVGVLVQTLRIEVEPPKWIQLSKPPRTLVIVPGTQIVLLQAGIELLPGIEQRSERRAGYRGLSAKRDPVGVAVVASAGGDCTAAIGQNPRRAMSIVSKVVGGRGV